MTARLIVMSGLPGAGKSAIAEALGRKLAIPVFAKDWLEAPLLRSGAIGKGELGMIGMIGYELLGTLARRQLELDQSAVLDSVVGLAVIRRGWRAIADEFGGSWLPIECICSDARLHRARLETRTRAIPGWPELTWAEVERVQGYFEPWDEERLVLDSVVPLSENIERALQYVGRSTG